jgi:chromatin remodeling complex protein RSC6|tara:strand:- start:17 stop:637 length:621 start_codon:yes stop_codon:yes gene_type:complete
MTTLEQTEPLTPSDKFDLLLKDFNTLSETLKIMNVRLKTLQKDVNKAMKSGKRQKRVTEVDPNAPKKISALQRPVVISNELCSFLGFPHNTEHSRQEVTSSINNYIKTNNLQDPNNRRFILLDTTPEAKKLKTLLRDPDQPVTFFNIQRYLKPHYPPSEKDKKTADSKEPETPAHKPEVVADAAVVPDPPKVSAPKPPVKRRVVKK